MRHNACPYDISRYLDNICLNKLKRLKIKQLKKEAKIENTNG